MPATTTAQPRKRQKAPASSYQMTGSEIDFVSADEFEELSYSDAELQLVQELITECAIGENQSRQSDSLLGPLTANTLPLLTANEERILFRRMNYTKFQAEAIRSTLSSTRADKRKRARIADLLQETELIRRRIAESNIRLVASITRKYASSAQEFQDFMSDGLLILLGAVQRFDYSRGFRFSTYATHAVQRHFFRVTQRQHRYSQRFVLTPGEVMAEVAGAEEVEEAAFPDAAVVYRQLMESAKGRLNDREQSILHRRFGTGGFTVCQTLREIASDLGISKERVRQIQISALDKLREVAIEANLAPISG